MVPPHSHQIGEQHTAYRRGMVLGLTMAEVGILIIFILLLLISWGELRKIREARASEGTERVSSSDLRELQQAREVVAELENELGVGPNAPPEEIRKLVRAVQEMKAGESGASALTEMRESLKETRKLSERIRDAVDKHEVPALVAELKDRVANQEGRLAFQKAKLAQLGLGSQEPPCWVRPGTTNEIDYVYDVVLGSDGIRMRELAYGDRIQERGRIAVREADAKEVLSDQEFLRRTRPWYQYSVAQNCRFFVNVYDATLDTEKLTYKRLLKAVEGHFYKREFRNARAPF